MGSDDHPSGARRPPPMLRAERQTAFRRKFHAELLQYGRDRRDAERHRMEEYRRLCEAEGIHSKRLEEYDAVRKEAAGALGERLQSIDYDQSLTNTEKKKRKFNLKRKYAAQTVTEMLQKKEKHHNALTKAEEIQKKRQEKIEEAKAAKKEREQMKINRIQQRKVNNALYAQKTRKGQPIMSGRVESLLNRLQQDQEKK
ncbi:Fyv7/TAP26 [Trypanosoma melophagium]|uniref:Fyv7/TAP26 n=1 Tax=Trypanosoma melophagium TaxID=715481 RepID=UPI00351A8E84|nr:Fyv7/TAP26 [Trypanosoma melophagium]